MEIFQGRTEVSTALPNSCGRDSSATILLIRHATTDAVGVRLTSRAPGIHLAAAGYDEVQHLRAQLRRLPISAVYTSPMERAIATAEPIADDHAVQMEVLADLNEVDFGDWSGLTFAELDRMPAWQCFNRARGSAPVPNGETAADVQRRIVRLLPVLAERHRGQTIVAVSHGDVIRNAVLHTTATPVDLWHTFEITAASITTLSYHNGEPRLLSVNQRTYRARAAQPKDQSAARSQGT
jgi:broad specificity phosphatase PhoE